MFDGAVGIILMLVSVVLCAICAEYWRHYRSLHLVPFAVGALFEVIIKAEHDDLLNFDGTVTLIAGSIFYGLTWLNVWSNRSQEKQRRALEAARLPKLPPWVQRDIQRTLQRAAPSRFFNVRTELPDESGALLITVDVPDGTSENDIVAAGQLIRSIVESRVFPFKSECSWAAVLSQNGHPVYSVLPE
jgi:hypothetical protein